MGGSLMGVRLTQVDVSYQQKTDSHRMVATWSDGAVQSVDVSDSVIREGHSEMVMISPEGIEFGVDITTGKWRTLGLSSPRPTVTAAPTAPFAPAVVVANVEKIDKALEAIRTLQHLFDVDAGDALSISEEAEAGGWEWYADHVHAGAAAASLILGRLLSDLTMARSISTQDFKLVQTLTETWMLGQSDYPDLMYAIRQVC